MKIEIPKYQQIAADIAAKIAAGDYPEGEKIYVRSALASQYGVSSETARRAVCVLADIDLFTFRIISCLLYTSEAETVLLP